MNMGFFDNASWSAPVNKMNILAQCGRCGLSKGCYSPRMAPTGRGKKRILFVAEAPGEEEDRKGIQLIGKAGQTLRKMLREIGEDLDDAYKTNAIICRPPKNEMDDLYIETCRPNLLKTIHQLKPNVIVALGDSAVKSLLKVEWKRDLGHLGQWVGWTIPSPYYGAWICPTYHPSFINRTDGDPVLIRLVKTHLKKAYSLEPAPPHVRALETLQGTVEVILDPSVAKRRIRGLAGREGLLAFDYETTGLKPDDPRHRIVACSFHFEGEETFACMLDPSHHRVLSHVLQNDRLRKIASNLKFEERWTRAKLGHSVKGWCWDTMLAAHVLDNRPGITSIKFQAYVHLGIPDYESAVAPFLESPTANGFNRITEVDPKDLLLYNGMDSLLEYEVSKIQMEKMHAMDTDEVDS